MKFKVTILEQNTNLVVSEIQACHQFPNIGNSFTLFCGRTGMPIKVEMLMEPDKFDQYDSTDDS